MDAMLLEQPRKPLVLREVPIPTCGPRQIRVRVAACGVCRTDLHIVDGELPRPKLPLVLGHEIIGVVEEAGVDAHRFSIGDSVGIPWLGETDNVCRYCRSGRENLCDVARFTGYDIDGGYAQQTVANEAYCYAVPSEYSAEHAAPLMCAGLIGYRSLKFTGDAQRVGIYGFGASAHIITQVARWQGRRIYAFTRPGDLAGQTFAKTLGAVWAGDSTGPPPDELDAAVIFAPVGDLVPVALRYVGKGGAVVCGGIHMSDIPSFPYELLWGERSIRSVANLTREDAVEFLALAPLVPVKTDVTEYPLARANEAIADVRAGKLRGAAVLLP